ncbi:MAG: helix-turn-helix transcriptional regulator [Candidatus Scatosoma sp.]
MTMKTNLNTKYNDYAFNTKRTFVGINLITAYHSICNFPYCNPLKPDPNWNTLNFVFFIISGSIKFIYGNEQTVVGENQIFFGNTASDIFLVDDKKECEYIVFHFQTFGDFLPFWQTYTMKKSEKELTATKKILRFLRMQSDLGVGSANAVFMDLLFYWLRQINEIKIAHIPHRNVMKDAELYINQHIEEKITVAQLAGKYNFSEKHFRYLFTQVIGTQPKKYIESVRLEHAYTLLKNTSLSVTEIAEKLNFSSVRHLASSFKRTYNITPSECRKNV